MKSMFKSKKSADTIETPPSAKASVGSSAWRRRVNAWIRSAELRSFFIDAMCATCFSAAR